MDCPTPLRRRFRNQRQARSWMIRNEVDGLSYLCQCGKYHVRNNPRS